MKYGCCTTMEYYDTVRELGFDYIELPGALLAGMSPAEVERTAERIAREGFPCRGLNAAIPAAVKICGPGWDLDAVRRYAKVLCPRAKAVGASAIGVGSPGSRRLPDGYDRALADRQAEDFLEALYEEADRWGISLFWESLNTLEAEYGVHLPQAAQLVDRLRARGLSRLWLVGDLYHMTLMGEHPADLEACLPLVKHLHICSYTPDGGRSYLLPEQLPGFRALLEPALRAGYSGGFSVEADAPGVAAHGADSLRMMKELTA